MPCKGINTKLLPMKIVMFGWFGASSCALPYMTVHMKELGLTVEETAIVYTLLPITQFLSTPVAGFIADRLGKYRNVLLLSIVMTIILATGLLYVPPINEFQLHDISEITLLCNDTDIIARISSELKLISNASILHLNSSHNHNCAETFNNNITSNMVIEIVKLPNYSACEYGASIRHSSLSSSYFMCHSQLSNIITSCSIICFNNQSNPVISKDIIGNNRHLTLCLYSALRIVYNIFSAIGFALVNSCAIALTETSEELGEYGRQRLWAMVSMAIFSPLAGVFVDLLSTEDSLNYAPAFHTHNVLAILTCIAVWWLDFEMDDAPSSYIETLKPFWKIIKNPSIFFLLLVIFWLGTVFGFMESFLFWFMTELNSPTYLMGLTVTVGSIVGVPFLYYARAIVAKFGHANLLSIALFMYMVRCIACSLLTNPWWIMPFEMLEIFTFHLMWVAAATYAAHLSPTGLLATIQGFIEGIHYGVGQGSGSLIGGSLMSKLGSRPAFQVMGGISGILAVIYSSLHFLWLRKLNVRPHSRRASIKSFTSQKSGRKISTLSSMDANGTIPPSSNAQETTT